MPRLPRSAFPAFGVFHLTTRGVGRRDVFVTRNDRLHFLELLHEQALKNRWRVDVLCLMTNHYHLVVEAKLEAISRGMHRLNGVYAEHFNAEHDWSGHLWGDRFALWQVRDDDHLEHTCAYVLANPVRAGLCSAPSEWPWSWSRFARRRVARPA